MAAAGPTASCIIAAVLHPRKADAPAAVAKLDSRQGDRLGIAIGPHAKLMLDLVRQSATIA